MGLALGAKLRRNGFFRAIEADDLALGLGLALAALMGIFLGIGICLTVKANRCLAVIVSIIRCALTTCSSGSA